MQETIRARVDSNLKEQFEIAAKAQGKNSSHVLREFMADFVQRHEDQKRRHDETLLAIESIEAGRYIEGDKVFAWMDTWGTDEEAEAPTCE